MIDLEIAMLSEVGQKEKDKYHRYHLNVGSKKNGPNELIYKTETVTDIENLCLPREKVGGGINWEIMFDICTLLHIK